MELLHFNIATDPKIIQVRFFKKNPIERSAAAAAAAADDDDDINQ